MRPIRIPIKRLIANHRQTRYQYDTLENPELLEKPDIIELAESIKEYGLLQPIGIAQNGDHQGLDDLYIVVYGHRRVLACKRLGLEEIDAFIIDDVKGEDLHIKNAIENLQREDLSIIEEGMIYKELYFQRDEEGNPMTIQKISKKLNISSNRISRTLLILDELDEDLILRKLCNQGVKKDHQFLYYLSRIKDKVEQVKMFERFQKGQVDRDTAIAEIKYMLARKKSKLPKGKNIMGGQIKMAYDKQGLKIRGEIFKQVSPQARFAMEKEIEGVLKKYQQALQKELESDEGTLPPPPPIKNDTQH
ncbi:hypothetical protein BKH46_08440 [Helicobacter sp. 12S02634-8]|uniref:ParB/RepB/Spo0J family partition protein n=1 Tax=Helicobacter sp. 12S02634-8 TaxID=1476199 RepID=UPI000BA5AAA7|nr:ParB/RepB/Spo0J family partition protein [Helicobacter sp. 12S02634-8]PAF46258.1 hypothetical protein BKH46_08440 [Helicobacter sp. 12S02634-8]